MKLRKKYQHREKKAHNHVTDEKLVKTKDEKKHCQPGQSADLKAKYFPEQVYKESEQLENSDLTEEHELPTVSSVCYLSDGTQSSNKRKRQDSMVDGSENPKKKIVLRFKLAPKKQTEPDSSTIEQDNICPSTGPETLAQERTVLGHKPLCHTNVQTKTEPEQLNLKPGLELPLSVLETEIRTEKNTSSPLKKAESVYRTLIEDWVPEIPIHQFWQEDDEGHDWLFGSRKQQNKQESKRRKADLEESCWRSSTPWPQAQHLSEADMWALPYTVPF